MIRSNLCAYIDLYILVKETVTVSNTAAEGAAVTNTNKKVIFKNCALFADCITEINNTQVDDARKTDVVMLMYNLLGYSDACSKTSQSLWQYYRDKQLYLLITKLLIFLLITMIVLHLSLNIK